MSSVNSASLVALVMAVSFGSFVLSDSPLTPLYSFPMATRAFYHSGTDQFGSGCGLGGNIPVGFIAIGMNPATLLNTPLSSQISLCGMCVEVSSPALGTYFAYVYDTCPDCTDPTSAISLGLPSPPSAGSVDVTYRAIPCPSDEVASTGSVASPVRMFWRNSNADKVTFQVRGLASPVVEIVQGPATLIMTGGGWMEFTQPDFPFSFMIRTALDQVVKLTVGAYRMDGDMTDLVQVEVVEAARATPQSSVSPITFSSTNADLAIHEGKGRRAMPDRNGAERVVITATHNNRQVVTIVNAPMALNDKKVQDIAASQEKTQ